MSVLMLVGTDQDAEECGSSPGQLRGPRAFSADVGVEVQTLERRDPSEGRRDRPRTSNSIISLFMRSRNSRS
jgi:hypothetical protein